MPRPLVPASQFAEPISWAADFDALRRILHELGKRSRLETLQLLLVGPRQTSDLPCRLDELKGLESLGLVYSERLANGRRLRWSIDREALAQVRDCLR